MTHAQETLLLYTDACTWVTWRDHAKLCSLVGGLCLKVSGTRNLHGMEHAAFYSPLDMANPYTPRPIVNPRSLHVAFVAAAVTGSLSLVGSLRISDTWCDADDDFSWLLSVSRRFSVKDILHLDWIYNWKLELASWTPGLPIVLFLHDVLWTACSADTQN